MRYERIACAGRGEAFGHGMGARGQHAGDYHDRAVVARRSLKPALQRDSYRAAVGGLNQSVHPAQAGGSGNVQQRLQHALADATGTKLRQHHQGKFRQAVLGYVLAVARHFAILAEGEDSNTASMIERIEAPQERQIRRIAMCEVALIEPVVIHCRKKAGDPVAIARDCRADRKLERICQPGQAGSHDASPLTKSTVASITSRSSSTRRCPRPEVCSSRPRGQLRA